ncbi:MAG TPA: hypothetical protein VEX70_10590 [Pyrinomonadaceae bacterium]|nr:hypothetical protein [Pyrinomonadaceae bacterium]
MNQKASSVKCAECGLVNFAMAETCKRCGKELNTPEGKDNQLASEPQQTAQTETQTMQHPNLTPCPDCAHLCSRMAEACPNCGRVLQQMEKPVRSILRPVVVIGIFAAVCVCMVVVYLGMQRGMVVQAAVQSGNPAAAGVSSSNREAARAALNAIGEIQSITSVGTNIMQYTSAIQSAKIKFDAAMRDYKPQDAADDEIERQLGEALSCYLDAREAWSEFIDHGSEFGFLDEDNSVVSRMAAQYGFSASSEEFYRGTVIKTIWAKASKNLNAVGERLR